MSIITVPALVQPEVKAHHKARHLKKFAIGPFAETCVEFRFAADIEKFDALDEQLSDMQQDRGWDLFIAHFNDQYHVAVTFFTDQDSPEDVVKAVDPVLAEVFGAQPETKVLAGDANYGEWEATYLQ